MSGRAASVAILSEGAVVAGHYEIVELLKLGGMGAVYRAIDLRTQRARALKMLLPGLDPEVRERFRREATITAAVRSEHLVEIVDAGVDEGTDTPYIAMELCEGPDLDRVLRAGGPLAPTVVLDYAAQLARALDRMHAASIVHRDLKPENLVVIRGDDGRAVLKVLDFGVAKLAESTMHPATTRALGTPAYMAPEQIEGDGAIGAAADLYTFAHVVFTLLAGEPYWAPEIAAGRGVYAILVRVTRGRLERASTRAARRGVALPLAFDAWFARAATREPAGRFPSGAAAVDALRDAFASQRRPPRGGLAAAGAVVAAAGLALAGLALRRPAAAPTSTETVGDAHTALVHVVESALHDVGSKRTSEVVVADVETSRPAEPSRPEVAHPPTRAGRSRRAHAPPAATTTTGPGASGSATSPLPPARALPPPDDSDPTDIR